MADFLYVTVLVYLFLLPFLGISKKAFLIAWSCPCGLAFVGMMFAEGHSFSAIFLLPFFVAIWGVGLTPLIFMRKDKKEIAADESDEGQ